MSRAEFPGSEFPDFPRLAIDIPEGWSPRVLPGTVLAAVLDRGPAAFSPNVVVTLTRGVGTTWEEAEAAVDVFVGALMEVERAPRERVVFGDSQWSVLEFAHVAAEVGTVFQIVAVTLVGRGPVVDSVRVTGSVAPENLEDVLPVLRRIIASVVVAPR